VTLRLVDGDQPGPSGGSVSADTRIRELRGELMGRAAQLSVAQDQLVRAVASGDGGWMVEAASRVQSVGFMVGEAARKWQRSIL
jgi:hypothetical protein